MKKAIQIPMAIAMLCFAFWVSAETEKNIETRMTAEQFKNSGLHKLTQEELAALNQWLSQHTAEREAEIEKSVLEKAQVTNETESFGMQAQEENAVQEISSTIASLRKTPYQEYVLTLENGQTWEQNEADRIDFKVGDEVTIKRAIFGSFTLLHLKSGRATKVKRRK